MYRYAAYGITINSELALPELAVAVGENAEVVIRIGQVGNEPPPPGGCRVTPDEACFAWDQLGRFWVRNGREIVVAPWRGVDERLIRLPLLGVVLATLLVQRGLFVLHASAVAIDGQAIAFLGDKGRGKSTLAAGFCARGYGLLADDVVAVDVSSEDCPQVLSGFPQLKLWPDSATMALGDDPAALPTLAPGYEKRARPARDAFVPEAAPLRGVYVIADGPTAQLVALTPHEAVVQLIAHSYAARFGTQLLRGAEASHHFRQCTNVARTVPAFSLERPRRLPRLPSVVQMVIQQTESLQRADRRLATVR